MDLLWLFLLLALCGCSLGETCSSKCGIAIECRSRLLVCRKATANLTIVEKVVCTKKTGVFSIGNSGKTDATFLDPSTLSTLADEGMKTVLFGVAISNLTRFAFHLLRGRPRVTTLFKRHYVRHVEDFSFEAYNVWVLFYNDIKDKGPETFCDSRRSPCLCKHVYRSLNTHFGTFFFYFNETDSVVCKAFFQKKCTSPLCRFPERSEFVSNLSYVRSKAVFPDDYCSSCLDGHPIPLVIALMLLTRLMSAWASLKGLLL